MRNEISGIDTAQRKNQFRLLIQARTYAIKHGGDVLTHGGPVRATTIELNVARRREQAGSRHADAFHHGFGKPSLQKFDQRIDRVGAVGADGLPLLPRNRRNANNNLVQA